MTAYDVQERVARGAAWLDETYPGWEEVIDLDSLQLADTCRCVLGQVGNTLMAAGLLSSHGAYRIGGDDERFPFTAFYAVLEEHRQFDATGYGFDAQSGSENDYAALQDAWTALLLRRAEAVKA